MSNMGICRELSPEKEYIWVYLLKLAIFKKNAEFINANGRNFQVLRNLILRKSAKFVSDIPTFKEVKTSQYADDIALYLHVRKGSCTLGKNIHLQKALDTLHKWCCKWNLKINNQKTNLLSFHKINKVHNTYHLNDQPLLSVNSIKFLGITFDEKLNFNLHTQNIINRSIPGNIILSKISKNKYNELNFKVKRTLYLSLIRSIMEYGAPILNIINKSNKHKLEVNQNKCLRLINNANISSPISQLLKSSNIINLSTRILNLTHKWFNKAKNNPNNIISKTNFNINVNDKYPTPFSFC